MNNGTEQQQRFRSSRVTHGEQDRATRKERADSPDAVSSVFTLTRVSARTEDAPSHEDGGANVMAVRSKYNG